MLFLLPALLAAPAADPSADLFKPTGPVPVFKITVDKTNLDQLNKEPRKYVRCTLVVGDTTLKDVAIHLKGAAGSFRNWNDKPALTLNVDHFSKGQDFRGLDKFHLNNSVQDNSFLNEILCGEMARKMDLPMARACHAVVELNGRKAGMYVLKEGFNHAFLKRYFPGADGGNLYDGGFLTDIDGALKLDTGPGNDRADLKKLAKACQEGDAKKRYEAVEKLLDVDRLVTDAVLQVVCTDWDGYCRNRNNYRLYFPPGGKAVFIPHGMDQEFQNPWEPLWHGWGGLAARAVLDTPQGRAKYIARFKEFVEKAFVIDTLLKRIDELAPRARTAMEGAHVGTGKWYDNEVKAHKDRLKARADVIKKELPKLK